MVIKMSERKRWFSKVYSDSQESRTDTDISWSNSDSEENLEGPPLKKRIKVTEFLEKSKSATWINAETTPPKKDLTQEPFLESPIFGEIRLEDQSLVLTQVTLIADKEESPVINRSKIIRKIKLQYKRKKQECETIQDEPSNSQSTLIIESPTQLSPVKSQVVISPAKSELSQPCSIDPFPSQHSAEVISDFSSASDPMLFLYHQPPSRKKRLKKGSLASQVQKAINLQNTGAAIWHHEVFLNKSKGEEIKSNIGNGIEFQFVVINKWREYGCTMLKCKCDKKVFSSFSHQEIENSDSFILVIGQSDALNVSFEANKSYQIFPPYSTRLVRHDEKGTICIIDASRFLSAPK